MQAIEYNPQRALTYEGETLPRLDWDGKKKQVNMHLLIQMMKRLMKY